MPKGRRQERKIEMTNPPLNTVSLPVKLSSAIKCHAVTIASSLVAKRGAETEPYRTIADVSNPFTADPVKALHFVVLV